MQQSYAVIPHPEVLTTCGARDGALNALEAMARTRTLQWHLTWTCSQGGTAAERNCPGKLLMPKRSAIQKIRNMPRNVPLQLSKSFFPGTSSKFFTRDFKHKLTTRICRHGHINILWWSRTLQSLWYPIALEHRRQTCHQRRCSMYV